MDYRHLLHPVKNPDRHVCRATRVCPTPARHGLIVMRIECLFRLAWLLLSFREMGHLSWRLRGTFWVIFWPFPEGQTGAFDISTHRRASVFSLDRRPQFHYSKPLSRLSLLFHSIFLNVTGRSESTALYSGAVSRNRNRTSS